MITLETVMAALPMEPRDEKRARAGFTPTAPGWSTTGHVAIRFTDYPPSVANEWPDQPSGLRMSETFPAYIASWEDVSKRTPVTEDEALFIAPALGIPDVGEECTDCHGSGEHECGCGDTHSCGECEGEGKIISKRGEPEKIGQAVFRSADGQHTLIQGKFACLLRGYSVFRFAEADEDPALHPLLGVDEDGRVMVCVLAMRGEPEKAEATP